MGRIYTLSNTIASFTGAKTIFELGAATNTPIKIHEVHISQSTSETDDSTLITIGRYTASGTGTDISANVEAHDAGDAAFSGTAEDNHTADISTGEIFLWREGISTLAGFHKIWTPETRPKIPGGGFFGVNVEAAVTAVTLVYSVTFEESD